MLPAACLPIPHTHLEQPDAVFTVRDSSDHPIAGAQVRLYSGDQIAGAVQHEAVAVTDSLGVARFDSHHEWHWMLVLIPDGETGYRWGWCADVPGYSRQEAQLKSAPKDTIQLRLPENSAATGCLSSVSYLHDVALDQH